MFLILDPNYQVLQFLERFVTVMLHDFSVQAFFPFLFLLPSGLASFLSLHLSVLPAFLPALLSSFLPLFKPDVNFSLRFELPVMMSIICSFVGSWISQVFVDQTDKCRAVCLQQCRIRQISGESSMLCPTMLLSSTWTLCMWYLFLSVYVSGSNTLHSTSRIS